VLLGLALTGCGGSSPPAGSSTLVGVNERDFRIATTTSHVSAGVVELRVHNAGPDQHELIVVAERRGGVPLRSDGLTVNEERIQSLEPGSLEPSEAGTTRYLRVRLEPGRYLLFCNMAGHFMSGMRTTLVVGP
jgi:uncharacterized cupredoxin-like copper-binding protein